MKSERKQYPSEPDDPAKYLEWLEKRNNLIKRYKPKVGIIGAGKPPKD